MDKMTSQIPRRVVTITDDFDLFHALLFYIYTDKICFTASPESFRGEFGDCPLISDGEGMYALAHRLSVRFHNIEGSGFLANHM